MSVRAARALVRQHICAGSSESSWTSYVNGVARTLKKSAHNKGRLLDQAVILFSCVPFQNGNFSERKEFAPRGSEFFPLRTVPCGLPH